jgi:ADP-heptose:LPS heptosyltransferase
VRILVVKPDALGDLVLATPVLAALKQKYPDSHLTLFARDFARELLWGNSFVDEIITQTDFKGYALVLHLFKDPKYVLRSFWAGNKIRVGEGSAFPLSLFLTHKIKTYADLTLHQVEQNLALLKPLGITSSSPELLLKADPGAEVKLEGKPIIALSIGRAGLHNKYWYPAGFAEVADKLKQVLGAKVLLLGSKEEMGVAQNIDAPAENLVGKLTLKQLVSVLSKCDLHISGDTGPMHLAAALKIPCVAIFTTKDHKPLRWAPWRTRHIILRKPTLCTKKCVPGECGDDLCAREITPDEVVAAAKSLLKGDPGMGFEDWCRLSFNILTPDPKLKYCLENAGYNVFGLPREKSLISFLVEKDINIIHSLHHSLRLTLASIAVSNIIGYKPLIVFGSPRSYNANEIIKGYVKRFKNL